MPEIIRAFTPLRRSLAGTNHHHHSALGPEATVRHRGRVSLPHLQWQGGVSQPGRAPDTLATDGADEFRLRRRVSRPAV